MKPRALVRDRAPSTRQRPARRPTTPLRRSVLARSPIALTLFTWILPGLGCGVGSPRPQDGDTDGCPSDCQAVGAAAVPDLPDGATSAETWLDAGTPPDLALDTHPRDGSGSVDADTPDDPRSTDGTQESDGLETGCGVEGPTVTVSTLLSEMADLGALARRSPLPFTTRLASSYDRRSRTRELSSDATDGWYANTDWGNYLRVETTPEGRTEYVMLDADGPGVITRIWSATPMGTIRFYLDGADRAVLTADTVALLSGRVTPLTPPYAGLNAHGGNLDFPFPFRQHAKVTLEGNGPASFYQVVYRQYRPSCADVVTYAPDAMTSAAMDTERSLLLEDQRADPAVLTLEARVDAVSTNMGIMAPPGGGEIVELTITPSATDAETLRRSVLALQFDGHETARAPLGDFFGAGPGLLPHRSLPLEARADGTFICRFVMPFAQQATLQFTPHGDVSAQIRARYRPSTFDSSTYYFHAHWLSRGPMGVRPYRDLTLASVVGEGAFVGLSLALGNSSEQWWGEGDEKIWVDDDVFPRWFGTGTEDYFGFAYSSPEIFEHPYRLQSLSAGPDGASKGKYSMARFHVFDVLRFDSGLRFDMEIWHWDPTATVTFDTVAYFYAAESGADVLALPQPEDFRLSPY